MSYSSARREGDSRYSVEVWASVWVIEDERSREECHGSLLGWKGSAVADSTIDEEDDGRLGDDARLAEGPLFARSGRGKLEEMLAQ